MATKAAVVIGSARERVESRLARIPFRLKLAVVWVLLFALLASIFLALQFDTGFMLEAAPFLIRGVGYTLFISVSGMLLALPLALLGALGRLSRNALWNAIAGFYVSFIRGTPLIVQIFFIYLALPQLGTYAPIGLQRYFFLGPVTSGVIALGVNYGAYMAEIFRAGILSVGHGQVEAAHALGMSRTQTLRRIVLPQAIRVIIPPTGNEFIAMLKDSALVSFLGVAELFFRASRLGRQNFQTLETLVVAAAVYWLLTSIFSYFQQRLENRMAAGYVKEQIHGH
jgi:polar amino acid transport system permease protein